MKQSLRFLILTKWQSGKFFKIELKINETRTKARHRIQFERIALSDELSIDIQRHHLTFRISDYSMNFSSHSNQRFFISESLKYPTLWK